jgi:hypothetical protein
VALQDAQRFAFPQIPQDRGSEWVHHAPNVVSMANLGASIAPDASVPVSVNHGRWVVDCPDCAGAQLACRTDHRFMCNVWGNVVFGGLSRGVDGPADADRIEALLLQRRPANQNWVPGETVDDLLGENLAVLGGGS